jgi:hypothetical protein
MSYFKDLTPYTYGDRLGGMLVSVKDGKFEKKPIQGKPVNVGWMELGRPLPIGLVSPYLIQKLAKLVESHGVNHMMGDEFCSFCLKGRKWHEVEEAEWKTIPGGSFEIMVPGDGVVYMAPELIVHYVRVHDYLPPLEFREALEKYEIPE